MLSTAKILDLYSSKKSDQKGGSRKIYHLSDEVVIKIPFSSRYSHQSIDELEFYKEILQEKDQWAFAKLIDYVELPSYLLAKDNQQPPVTPILFFERLSPLYGRNDSYSSDNYYYDDDDIYGISDIIKDIYEEKAKEYGERILDIFIKYGLSDIIGHLPNWGVDCKGNLKILDVGYYGSSIDRSIDECTNFIDDFDLWDSYLLLSQRKYFEKSSS